MKKKKNNSFYIVIIIVLIFCLVFYGVYNYTNRSKSPLLDKGKEIVYLYYSNEEFNQKVPAINIKSISDGVNSSINEFVNPYLNKEYVSIDYHYNISGNILSLLITLSDYSKEGVPDYTFKSVIINLRDLKVLDNKEILELYNTNIDNIVNIVEDKFKECFEDELKNGIIANNISYEEYLKSHGIYNYYEQVSFDIVNSKLIIYLDFVEFAEIETEYYFENVGHSFSLE